MPDARRERGGGEGHAPREVCASYAPVRVGPPSTAEIRRDLLACIMARPSCLIEQRANTAARSDLFVTNA